jgi:hypothetical protein
MSNVDQRVFLSSGAQAVLDEEVTCICEPDNIMATGTSDTAHRGLKVILANKRGK